MDWRKNYDALTSTIFGLIAIDLHDVFKIPKYL